MLFFTFSQEAKIHVFNHRDPMGPLLNRPLKSKHVILFAMAYLGLQAACIKLVPAHAMGVSYPFMILAPWLALAVCWWHARTHAVRTRLLWMLLCAALAIWGVGILFAAREDLSLYNPMAGADFSDFLFFVYGMPVLLAISSPTEGEQNAAFVWLDAIQVLMTAFLIYVAVFSVLPFAHRSQNPLSVSRLLVTYNIEGFALAAVATLRLLAYTTDGEERRFYQVLCSYLWIYAVLAALYNHITISTNEHTGLYDLLTTLPFAILSVAAVALFGECEETVQSSRRKPLTLFIDNASPIFFTVALLVLGAALVRQHFYIGMSGIAVALAVYAVRATLLQSRYMQAQHELQAARDTMEAMSLTDSLTGVANRRSFDRTLEVEWRRAVRRKSPLSLLMIDVDYFKNLNDKYGHPYGDACLIEIAQALQSALPRTADLLARYGGEEFGVILSATDARGADTVAFRMREFARALHLKNETPIGQFVTISIGAATYEFPHDGSSANLIQAADEALYQAKRHGRDRIVSAASEIPTKIM
ncbi:MULTISPECIES: diguanylate cyclase [Acidobacteriaceae]|uniref:GGDEF domain-containing protein n=1 Tax=Acidobacteriaceae TaxID=204434 RepID=UPI00131C83B1|nr:MULTISPECIES: GGDEF domain-containing protein [Acidobacteriaceae]MDW5265615.1 GGDEF domain-containing protein [Edaphobacter sp.]